MMTTLPHIVLQTAVLGSSLDMLTLMVIIVVIIAFTVVFLANRIIKRRVRQTTAQTHEMTNIMQHALDLGNIHVLHFLTGPRYVHNLHGQLLPDGSLSFDDFYAHIHEEDRLQFELFIQQFASRQTKAGECGCRLRIATLDEGRTWRNMHCQAIVDTEAQQPSIICTMTDETEAIIEQQEEQELTDKYRIIFDQTFIGLAFYDQRGMLLAVNQPMRQLLHFQSEDDPFYYQSSLFDMPLYRDIVDRRCVDDIYFCTRAVIPERGVNAYMEIRIHPIADDTGQLRYLSVATRDITEERNMYLQSKQNNAEIQRANEEIQQYESELQYLMENCDMRVWRTSFANREITFYKGLSEYERRMTFEEFQATFIDDDGTIARNFNDPESYFSKPVSNLCRMRSIFHDTEELQWNVIDSIPVHNEEGKLEGCFGTIRNMTALMNAQEQLKEETRRANDSGRLKSVFMANMTHEIRTPLNSIVGFSDLLPMIDSADDKREMVRVIMNNCDMLLRLINDILEISSMDSNAIALEPADVDFAKEFDDICQTLAQRVQEPTVEFIKENPYPSLRTHIDMRRVQQVITNFVTNAVKYTHQGHIKVGYRPAANPTAGVTPQQGGASATDGLIIYCEDTGAGIPKEKQAVVFERFVKLNDYVQGTGLGLSICKAIANRAGGSIGVDSEGEGKGSTFWLWLPCPLDTTN